MQDPEDLSATPLRRLAWNKGKLVGAKPPLRPKHVWAVRTKLQVEGRIRELAMFNLAIDSKLNSLGRAGILCPLVSFVLLVKKQNSHNRMTLKLVKYLYRGALECCFAQSGGKISGIVFPNTTYCDQ